MIACNPGDIVLVRFPFTDLTSTKRRPAVVLNDASYPRTYGDFVLIPLTSQPQSDQSLAPHEWSNAGLPKPTWVKPVIGTISESLVLRVIGAIDPADDAVIRAAIRMAVDRRWIS